MVDVNATRATLKKIKDSSSLKTRNEDNSVANSLIPGGNSGCNVATSDASTQANKGSSNVQALNSSLTNPGDGRAGVLISDAIAAPSIMTERQQMWDRAVTAQESGDRDLAEMLFKAIGCIGTNAPKQISDAGIFARPVMINLGEITYLGAKEVTATQPATRPHVESQEPEKFFLTEGDLVYAIGSVTNHNSVGFAPFLDENIRKLRSPLPLTIFNQKWQQRAMAHHLDQRQRSDDLSADKDKSGGYKGFSFVQEWTQTYAQWTCNHRAFAKTLHDVYKIIKFSKLLATHKNNCDDITEEFGFMVAFRYDMEVRSNTFSHRITNEDVKNAIPDISQRKESVVEQCYNTCRNFGELEWEENLYAPGLLHSNHDPLTGYLKPLRNGNGYQASHHNNAMIANPNLQGQIWMNSPTNGYMNSNMNGGYSYNPRANHHANGQGGGSGNQGFQNGAKRPRGGYKGGNYTEGYGNRNDGGQASGKKNNHNKHPLDIVQSSRPFAESDDNPNARIEWPQGVKCEMNIELWEEALQKAGILSKYEDVLLGFRNGFDQGIPTHKIQGMPWFTPDNHLSARLAEDKIRDSMKKELAANRMFGPFTIEEVKSKFQFFRTSPLGAVVNGDSYVRPINDLSFPHGDPLIPSVNSFVNKHDFETTWDDFNEVSSFFKLSEGPLLLALFDWEKAYRQIPTHPSQWPYLMVKGMDENLYLDTRITFDGVAGCGSFGRPADAWKEIMFAEFDLIKVFRWVDDNLFVKKMGSKTDMIDIVNRSVELGVLTNLKKCSTFSEEQKFISFLWNGVTKTVRLPEEKLEQRKKQILEFLDKTRKFSFNEVEVLTGRLNHVSYMLPQLQCYLRSLYRWMCDWFDLDAKRFSPEDVLLDLGRWIHTLNNFKHSRLISSADPVDIGWVGDASTSFGIGVLIGKHWSQLRIIQD
ncbi:uncharacterized protein PGTG_21802 [Puccinia graminis f. sp. tritici CRL 75-36-700-3]|uniref:Reverse transcriptase domain-containing protein n=1 Tax=Puccinia graminis f. sp. tritici (strain CRL 75-36-700-3 / race SCCL) TaxID=418459 RepID=H6QSJ4_PUCGT|nr:uncharacterized protein PGTG_21802 [Puccinia graminis f. sp. tritici CRL 75-36-700-3]EHS63726.1 hypothetical protein PGTG_21802 [Puccinia graminis f. sp. tritici CRL 75-36-700-3]